MTRTSKLYLLVGVLAVGCAATFAVTRIEDQKEQIKNSEEILFKIAADDVEAISWEYEDQSFAFHKDETWIYDDDEAFPVSDYQISQLFTPFASFGTSFTIEDVEDFAQYGLADPLCTIHLKTEERSYQIELGDYSKMDAKRYVSIGDGNVYLANTDPLDTFAAGLEDLIQHDKVPLLDNVRQVTISGAHSLELVPMETGTEKYSYSSADKYFVDLGSGYIPVDSTKVSSYLSNVYKLDLSNYKTYHAAETDFAAYGLDDPELTLKIDYTDSKAENPENADLTYTLNISKNPAQGTDAAEGTAFANVEGSGIIYEITAAEYENIMACSYNDLRHAQLFTGDYAAVTQIDIRMENIDYIFTSEMKDDSRIYYYDGEEISFSAIRSSMQDLKAKSFTDEIPTAKEEINLVLHLDNDYFPKVELTLYRYDGSFCLALVDGESVAFIKRSDVVELMENIFKIVL